MDGICTLANDRVYDQLVALLNSIEVTLGTDFPICVYPYDTNVSKISAEIARRSNVQLYQDLDSIERWDNYVKKIWDAHPTAQTHWQKLGFTPYHRIGTHRRFCAFDAPFDRFLYIDADTLLLNSIEPIFSKLDDYDWVVHDFQHTDLTHVYDVNALKLTQVFPEERLRSDIFCSGFYTSKKDVFDQDRLEWFLENLKNGEAEILYPMAPDQTVLNYMVMRSNLSIYNFALQSSPKERTGCCVTSSHFEERDGLLYDHGNRLTYLHYIGLPSKLFSQICMGDNITFPYRDLFLYYRFLYEPERYPKFRTQPKPYDQKPNLIQRTLSRFKLLEI
jgi:hypothetical protein